MKIFSIIIVTVFAYALFMASQVWFNWYPFGYPTKAGDCWYIQYDYDEGTPMESHRGQWIRIDSTHGGYIIKAHNATYGSMSPCRMRTELPDQGLFNAFSIGAPDKG